MGTHPTGIEMENSVRLDSYSNVAHARGPVARRIAWTIVSRLFFQTHFPYPSCWKRTLLRGFGARIGRGVLIKPSVTIKYPWKLSIGEHSWIGEGVWIDNLVDVHIGAHCCISQGAMLVCGNHDYTRTGFDLIQVPIRLEQGVWIGARATLGPGSVCGQHSVLALGSTCAGQMDAWTIYRGNPAVPVKTRRLQASE